MSNSLYGGKLDNNIDRRLLLTYKTDPIESAFVIYEKTTISVKLLKTVALLT